MTLDDLPDAPDPANDPPATFSTKAAAMVLAIKKMIPQLRAMLASIGIIASGNANKIPYQIDLNSQAVGDPGAGWLRLNAATQNTATVLLLDLLGADQVDYTALIASFATSTSSVRGTVRIEKQGDASKFLIFALTALATPAGYRQLTVTPVQGSSANPFVHGDLVNLMVARAGDKGDTGPVNSIPHAKFTEQYASGTVGAYTGAGTVMRPLNTVVDNNIPGASMSSSIITLPAGTYDFRGRAGSTGGTNTFAKVSLLNITDSLAYQGSSRSIGGTSTTDNAESFVIGRFTIAAAKTFMLQHYFSGNGSQTFGGPAGNGYPEIYAEIDFWKIF